MCGICGVMYFDNTEVQVSPTFLEGMVSTMKHRGPDGEGVWVSNDEKVGLGHARLSIIDLSVFGAQPMGNEDGTVKLRLMEKFIIIANSGPILKKKTLF